MAQTQAEVGRTIWRNMKEGRSGPCSLLKGLEGNQWPRVGSAWASLSALPDACPPQPSVLQGDRGGRGVVTCLTIGGQPSGGRGHWDPYLFVLKAVLLCPARTAPCRLEKSAPC